jgi:stage II sporulation protein AA (anti-sigma F factor antagonist)
VGVNREAPGQGWVVEEPTNAGDAREAAASAVEPEVSHVLEDDTARITVAGELTDAARRPLVRTLTELLLNEHSLRRVELHLRAVPFMNSAGLAVLVQLQRMAAPKAVEIVLVEAPPAVVRPLQLTGLWHRFTVLEPAEDVAPE